MPLHRPCASVRPLEKGQQSDTAISIGRQRIAGVGPEVNFFSFLLFFYFDAESPTPSPSLEGGLITLIASTGSEMCRMIDSTNRDVDFIYRSVNTC